MKKRLGILLMGLLILLMIGCSNSNEVMDKLSNDSDKEDTTIKEDTTVKDDITFESFEVEKDSDEYFKCTYKVKNNTNNKITFHGISIYELDENGDILDSWYSYNQGDVNAEVESNQSIKFDTIHEVSQGITQIKSISYTYEDENGEWIEKDFLNPIIIDCSQI